MIFRCKSQSYKPPRHTYYVASPYLSIRTGPYQLLTKNPRRRVSNRFIVPNQTIEDFRLNLEVGPMSDHGVLQSTPHHALVCLDLEAMIHILVSQILKTKFNDSVPRLQRPRVGTCIGRTRTTVGSSKRCRSSSAGWKRDFGDRLCMRFQY